MSQQDSMATLVEETKKRYEGVVRELKTKICELEDQCIDLMNQTKSLIDQNSQLLMPKRSENQSAQTEQVTITNYRILWENEFIDQIHLLNFSGHT
jgi:hypothetical protein